MRPQVMSGFIRVISYGLPVGNVMIAAYAANYGKNL